MTDRPILYSFRRCPYAMRARMAVTVSGARVELREVVLRDKPPEMIAVSPKGTVPVLVVGDDHVVDESLDIMRWALAQNDPADWLAHADADMISANDGPFKQALDRYKYPHRYGLADGLEHREVARDHLSGLNDVLAAQPYLGGSAPAFTDIALFPFVRQFAATDPLWFDALPLPALQAWLNGLLASDLFGQIMTRYPKWTAGDEIILFP
ncbi:MAG: glutathione S-transferase [Sphingomonadaceae bacterium]|uniref:glutathione S-transferase n=1 Tax=Sphingorhabdus sp. TaxID=1902408 RepID=UPI0039BCEA3F|nr:glutathione S-transferase [Sphingomonadaceae bacterium]